jgi:signal transduction histidine kinase/CheY-like chemotaxis protein
MGLSMSLATTPNLNFRCLLEASPEVSVVVATDSRLTILAASDAFLETTMKSREELVGHALFDIFPEHPDDPSATEIGGVRAAMIEAIETNETTEVGPYRFDLRRPDEHGGGYDERYWKQRNVPICDESGEVVYLIHRAEDVTDFVMSERRQDWRVASGRSDNVVEELRQSMTQTARRQFYDMFMKAPAFICMLEGAQHVFMMANPAYYELIDRREVVGHSVREVFPEAEMEAFIALVDSVYETGTPQFFEEEELVFRAPDSDGPKRRYATFAYLPIFDPHGNVEGVACFGFEVTELVNARKKVEQQAARAERENQHKDEFLAMLGHELRNPLAPIATAIEVLRASGEDLDSENVHWAGELIHRQLEQLVRLVDDLLDVARINQGLIELKEQRCTLDEIITVAVESCRPLLDRKKHALEIDVPQTPVELEVDAARLTQVLTNLLNNACKYTTEGGRIELAARVEGENLIVEVSDNGQGIDPDLLPYIFNLFTQADTSLDRAQGGLGLGLTLVRRLVEIYGGDVEVSSEGRGCGSQFRVELPVMAEPGRADETNRAGAELSGADCSDAHRVLVVDDNRDAADTLAMMLASFGNEVEVAYDGKAALALAERFCPDIMFLDIGLPEMDGYQVARQLRSGRGAEHLVIIAVTGYGQDSDRKLAYEAGFDHHLVKPASRDDIHAVLEEAAARSQ